MGQVYNSVYTMHKPVGQACSLSSILALVVKLNKRDPAVTSEQTRQETRPNL